MSFRASSRSFNASSTKRKSARSLLQAIEHVQSLESRVFLSASLLTDSYDYPLGNFTNVNLSLNGNAAISNATYSNQLQLTTTGANQAASAFTSQATAIDPFESSFGFQLGAASSPNAGLAFVIQSSSASALGTGSDGSSGIAKSVAISFDDASGASQTSLSVNGSVSAITTLDSSGIHFGSGDVINVDIRSAAGSVVVSETDATTHATASQTYNAAIPGAVGPTAYVGFTGATGSMGTQQNILNWEFSNQSPAVNLIGSPTSGASSSFANGSYALTGAGTGFGSTLDQVSTLTRIIGGDSTLIAQINLSSPGTQGLIVRDSNAANSAFAALNYSSAGFQFTARATTGASATSSATVAASGSTAYLKLVTNGPTVSGYVTTDPVNGTWTLVGTSPIQKTGNQSLAGAMMGFAVSSGSASSTVTASFSNITYNATVPLGLDTGGAGRSNMEQEQMWVNVINEASGVFQVGSTTAAAPTDANGWPTTDFSMPAIMQPYGDSFGVYTLSMQVAQNPTVAITGGTLSNANYSNGVYTASITINTGAMLGMTVTNTNGGATNIKIIRPGYSLTNTPVFTTNYVNMLKALNPSLIRFMNFTAGNNNPTTTWASRTMPSDALQTGFAQVLNYDGSNNTSFGLQAKGTAWEYAIELANTVHADMWINIPAEADDNYITQLANLIKNGDTVNGVNYPALSPDLNVYIEYSNETWNNGFAANGYTNTAATKEVTTDAANGQQSNLNYDNLDTKATSSGTYKYAPVWQERWTARRIVQIGQIFAGVFGPNSLNTRIRPVLANLPQASVHANQLAFIASEYGAPANYIYADSTATYANMNGPNNSPNTLNGGNNNPNMTAKNVLDNLSVNGYALTSLYDSMGSLATQYGLQLVAYESGPDLSGSLGTGASGAKVQAETSPLFETFLEQYYSAWFAHGGGATIFFTGGVRTFGNIHGDFQITDSNVDLSTAKVIAYEDVRNMQRPITLPAIPTGLAASNVTSNSALLTWAAPVPGVTEYFFQASTKSDFSANIITQSLSSNLSSATTFNFTGLLPGLTYYFRMMSANTSGESNPSTSATGATTGTLTAPAAPSNVVATDVNTSTVNLRWQDNSLNETSFTVLIATDANFTQNLRTVTTAADASTLLIEDLNGATTYYFAVQAVNSVAPSAKAVSAPLTTPPVTAIATYTFTEGSGTVALDTSNYGTPANGTLTGGVTRGAGPNGDGAVILDGATGYVDVGRPAKLNLQGQITVSGWVKPTSLTAQMDVIAQDWNGLTTPFYLAIKPNNVVDFGTYRFTYYDAPTVDATGTSPASLTDGNWHFVAGVYDGAYMKVYVDGALVGKVADPYGVTDGTQPTNIGRNSNGGAGSHDYFNGAISNVQMFGAGLSDADIAKLYNQAPSQGPVASADSYTTLENQTLTVNAAQGVLANDSDPNNLSMTATLISGPATGTLTLNSDGSFTYVPANDANGQMTFTYSAVDAKGSSSATTVTLNLTAVNQQPTFTASNPPAVVQNAGTQTINNWATFNAGAPNESGQSVLAYTITNVSNAALFSALPSISTAGVLTYTPAAGATGTSTFTVTVQDNGGTANGGVNTSTPQTFTITVNGGEAVAAPSNVAASNISANGLTLTWSESSAVTGFVIQQSTDNSTWTTVATPGANATSQAVGQLLAGTNYYFRIAATSGQGNTNYTGIGPVATSAPAVPQNLTTGNIANTSLNLLWSETTPASGFAIQVSTDNTSWSTISPTITTTQTGYQAAVTGLTAGTNYYFRVQATGNAANSGYATSGVVATAAPNTPTNFSDSNITANGVTLDWVESTPNVAGFEVDESTDNVHWSLYSKLNGSTTSTVVTNLSPGSNYWFRVEATGPVSNSGFITLGPVSTSTPAAPGNVTASNIGANALTLTWNESTNNVSGFVVQESTDNNVWTTIATPNASTLSVPVTGLNPGTNYYFQVEATGTSNSAYTGIGPVATAAPAAPTGLAASAITTTGLSLNWSEPTSGVSGFVLQQSSNGTTWTTIANPGASATSAVVSNLSPGTSYYFQLQAISPLTSSGFDKIGPVATSASTTIIQTIDSSTTVQTGHWWYSTSIAGYYGSHYLNDGDQQQGTKSVAFNFAVPSAGNYDVSVWFPAAAGNASNVPVTIATASGPATVVVNERTNGGQWLDLGVFAFAAGNAPVTFSNTAANGLVVANAVKLAPSAAQPTPTAPYNFTATAASSSAINLAWAENSGLATGFVLQESTDNASWTTIASPGASATTYGVSGLSTGISYYFRIAATGTNGNSAYASAGPVTLTGPATNPIIDTVATSSVTLTGHWWYSTSEAGHYGSQYANDGNQGQGTKSAAFNFNVPSAGNYDVSVYYPAAAGNASNVPVTIATANGPVTVTLNERINGGRWFDLGNFAMAAGNASVTFSNTGANGLVVANAVKLTPMSGSSNIPPAPSGFAATAASATSVNLSWTENSSLATGFIIQKSTDGTTWTSAATPAAGASSAIISGLTAGSTYTFRILATGASGNSAYASSNAVTLSAAPTVVQTIASSGVTINGKWWYSSSEAGYYGSQYVNDGNQGQGTKSVVFNPTLPSAGQYAVSVWYPASASNASNASVTILGSAGSATATVNEKATGGQWVLLGNYAFAATGGQVIFSNKNANGLVVVNAVQFVKIG